MHFPKVSKVSLFHSKQTVDTTGEEDKTNTSLENQSLCLPVFRNTTNLKIKLVYLQLTLKQKLFLFLLHISTAILSWSFHTQLITNPFAEPPRSLNSVWAYNLMGSKLPGKGGVKSCWIKCFAGSNCWVGYWATSWNTILSRTLRHELGPLLPPKKITQRLGSCQSGWLSHIWMESRLKHFISALSLKMKDTASHKSASARD